MRLLWIVAMLAGVIVLGGLAVFTAYVRIEAGADSLRALSLPIWLILAAGACGAGIFMRPREFQALLQEEDEAQKPAAWIEEMRIDPKDPPR